MFQYRSFSNFCFGVAFCVFIINANLKPGYAQDFGYDGDIGPDHWQENYATCVGKHQSPINIDTSVVEEVQFGPLKTRYIDKSPDSIKLVNNGHTVMVQFQGEYIPEIYGGPLNGVYKFAQFHFHWGDNDTFGSETQINNQRFPLELHMVFYKKKYESAKVAMDYADGLTVLSFLYEISPNENLHYRELIKKLRKIDNPDTSATLLIPVTLKSLVDPVIDDEVYFAYNGSLTTPPCSEVVQWIEFLNPIHLSHNQVEEFRHLHDHFGLMHHNFRPIQPLNDRQIFMNVDRSRDNNIPGRDGESKTGRGAAHLIRFNYDVLLAIFVVFMCSYNYL